jgi:hypothetical protein
MANIQSPDALLQNYVAGNEEALSTLIKDMNQEFMDLFILKLQIETFQMIFPRYFY